MCTGKENILMHEFVYKTAKKLNDIIKYIQIHI